MKKLFFCLVLLLVQLEVVATRLTSINEAVLDSGSLILAHDSKSNIQFKKSSMLKPPRLIFDILNADLKGKNQSFTNLSPDIRELRLAQFSPTTVRIVVEGTNSAALESIGFENLGSNLYFRFSSEKLILEEPVLMADGDLVIKANGTIKLRSSRQEAPSRLTVDIVGASLKDPATKKTLSHVGEQIKISQLDASTVRIVFIGRDSLDRAVVLSEDKKQVSIEAKASQPEDLLGTDKTYTLSLLSQNDNESVFLIKSSKDINYKFLNLHNPERVVVDLYGTAYDAKQVAMAFTKTAQVAAVRFGIATLGRPVTRAVFDLTEEGLIKEFKPGASNKELILRIYKLTPDKQIDGGTVTANQAIQGSKVVVDAGHGGYDPGAVYDERQEKDITLQIARKIKQYLEEAGVTVYMTRSEDRFVSLAERVEVSNTIEPDAFVSIHANALPTNPRMEGLQTYYHNNRSKKLANAVHQQLLDDVKMPDQRVRNAGFWVCKHTAAPSILVETGFMTCAKERRRLVDDNYQSDLAKAVSRGLIKYLEEGRD